MASEPAKELRLYFESESQYNALRSALLPKEDRHYRECGAFLFASATRNGDLHVVEVVVLKPSDFAAQTAYHLKLCEDTLQRMIVRAHTTNTALIEAHSHPLSKGPWVRFSSFDCEGLADTGPHMAWRLPGRPYVALVFGQDAFDSLYWEGLDRNPQGVMDVVVAGDLLRASRESARAWRRGHG